MKHLRLVALVLAVSAGCAVLALAAGAGKGAKVAGASDCCGAKATTAAASAPGACPATMSCPTGSAQCTAAQRAQCARMAKSKGATAAAGSCSMHGASATAASASCAMHGASATAASNCTMGGKTAAAAGTCTMGGKTAAAAGSCAMHATAAAGGKADVAVAAHGDCVVCADQAACDEDVRVLNAHAQVVPLRNGSMIVYTAETPESVRALQAALARHNELVMAALAANGDASLCGGCKSFRGAMASGKFSRELVNVKSGVQVLLTSNDREIVQRIHDMTVAATARTKS
jgi:hypothetical protein